MTRPPLLTFCSIIALLAAAPVYAGQQAASAAPNSVQGIADREIARRNELVSRTQQAIADGDKAMEVKDYEAAVTQYKAAADMLSDSPVTHKLRECAVDRYCEASVRLAEQQIAEGNFAKAEVTLKAVLAPNYDPGCSRARRILAHLAEPGYYNKTITPKFMGKVEQVRAWFVDAEGFYASGQYEKAMQRYDMILDKDPTNEAAREGQIKVDLARTKYAQTAYEETRARALWKVENAWQQPIRKYGGKVVVTGTSGLSGSVEIQRKLASIIIPKVEFNNATVREAIDFLKMKTKEMDPDHKGINIVLQLEAPAGTVAPAPTTPPAEGAAPAIPGTEGGAAAATTPAATTPTIDPNAARITLSLANVPTSEVLRYITTLAGLKVKIDPYAVAVVPLSLAIETLITKEYKIPPGLLSASTPSSTTAAPTGPAAATAATPATTTTSTKATARDYFSGLGVLFPPGSSATYLPAGSKLIVKNTQEQLDLIDALVDAMNTAVPSQVDIEAKFVEITQTNLKELGFDWRLGQFNIPGSKNVFGGGGTPGNGNQTGASDWGFVDPYGNPVGSNPVTAGNRTGSGIGGAITGNAIDSLLFPKALGASAAAPAVFSIAGVFTDPQFQVAIRALNQKKGVDLLSSPRVTCKSGQDADIDVVREFKYPTEYNPPQVPTSSSATMITVTPTTPTAFDVKQVGVRLHVQPTVGSDGSTIDLQLEPQVVEFEGFINYGSPIYGIVTGSLLNGTGVLLTENVINQPIFSTRKVRTSVSIWDGQTVMLGGLMREDVQKVEDKLPFMGDLPLIGRLFRSSTDQHIKRNLVIFVTARLINPAGDPLNVSDDEKEDESAPAMAPADATLIPPVLPTK